jgi:NAD(P)-dependent dehydrogenase (short-subunit alcohol dehydrogenase family)
MNILITGATDGIGKQTALELAQQGHSLFIHGRNSVRLSETKSWIQSQVHSANIECLKADFASLREVKQMANSFLSKEKSLDVLINNAGVFEKQLAFSTEGYERTFAINHLAPFYLTHLLLPHLKSRSSARIINVASMAQATLINFNALNSENGYNAYDAYELSKLCNILFTFKLAKNLKAYAISVNTLHPGVISTKVLHAGWSAGGGSWHEGASNLVYLASSAEGASETGHYYINKQKSRATGAAYSIENQDKLWEKSLELCGINVN